MGPGRRDGTATWPPIVFRAAVVYAVSMLGVEIVHVLWPGARGVTWALAPALAAVGLGAGTVVNKSAVRTPWLLIGAGFWAWAAQNAYLAAVGMTMSSDSPPMLAQTLSAAGYLLSLFGLIMLVREHSGDIRAGFLDGLLFTCALALLGWVFFIVPYVGHAGAKSSGERALALVYPLSGAIRAPLLARLFTGGTGRAPVSWLLAGGAVAGFGSDISLAVQVMAGHHPDLRSPGLGIGWFLFYLAWGAAGLHPSMRALGAPTPPKVARVLWPRVALLGGACLAAPLALLFWAVYHSEGELAVLAVFASVAILLVLTRLGLIFADYRRAGSRERIVSRAGAAMVSAVQRSDVFEAVDLAGQALFAPTGRFRLRLVRRYTDEPLRGNLVPRAALPPELAEATGGYPAALVFPLAGGTGPGSDGDSGGALRSAEDPISGEPGFPVLMATGTAHELIPLHKSVETIAAQAALALDRLELANEVRRRASEEYFRTLIQNAADGILILSDGGVVRYASPSASRLFAPEQLIGRRFREIIGDAAADRLRDIVVSRGSGQADLHLQVPGGQPFDVHATVGDFRQDATVGAIVLTLRDVTEQRRLEAQLTEQALHDPLTGLPNRRFFQQRLQSLFAGMPPAESVYLLLIDLDDFKDVNDTKGHSIGDQLLVAAGKRLNRALRPGDIVARIGGDEFAVLLEPSRGARIAEGVAERIVRSFTVPFALDGEQIAVGVSIGFAGSAECASAEELLRNADVALYAAKNGGKRRWRHYETELAEEIVERAEVRASLDKAIADHTIRLDYQAVVELGEGRIAGFEALVRWPHPRHGLLLPGRFIPLAEQTGQIVPLGRWILRQAVAEAARWRGIPGAGRLWVAVNVSGRQFADPGFVDGVAEALAESGLQPGLVVLELTETSLLQHVSGQASKMLEPLKDLGVRVALDDFGTGFSSLSYLSELPVDILKIDKSFVARITESSDSAALVEGIVRIADALRIAVIAEGIENMAQWHLLRESGCEFGQGYLFGRPMVAPAVHDLLSTDPAARLPAS